MGRGGPGRRDKQRDRGAGPAGDSEGPRQSHPIHPRLDITSRIERTEEATEILVQFRLM